MQIISCFLKTRLMSETKKDIEILALRSQLSILQQEIYNHKIVKPHFTPTYHQLWVMLSKLSSDWKSYLFLVKPKTVIGWHKTAFKHYWMLKSKKPERHKISRQTISLIKHIHKKNPLLSPQKIYERLINLNINDVLSPNTIAKYIPKVRRPPTEKQKQSWRTFLSNHKKSYGQWTF